MKLTDIKGKFTQKLKFCHPHVSPNPILVKFIFVHCKNECSLSNQKKKEKIVSTDKKYY